MKKHIKLFPYLLVESTLLLLLSCDKDELVFEEELSINDSNFSMMNRKLKFDSKEDLAETINYQKMKGVVQQQTLLKTYIK